MSTITDVGYLNLADVMARMNPDGSVRPIGEILNKQIEWISDVPWKQCNLDTGHQLSFRTGLPSAQWRALNEGVSLTKSTVGTYVETCGIIEDRAEVDVDMPGNMAQNRLSEITAKVEMMGQEWARAIFYESTYTNVERIHGLSARYGATTGYTSSSYVLKPGTNSGTNAHSIWLIDWAPDSIYGIFPKNSVAGLQHKDLGEIDCTGTNSKKFRGYADKLQWKCGLAVEDYRQAVRFQWDPDDTSALFGDSHKGMYLAMQDMLSVIKKKRPGRRFYMDLTSLRKLRAQLSSNDANFLQYVAGGDGLPAGDRFLGVPIRETDVLVAETAIA